MQAEKQFLCIMQTVGVVLLKKKKRRKKPSRRLVNTQWAEEPRLMALLLKFTQQCCLTVST